MSVLITETPWVMYCEDERDMRLAVIAPQLLEALEAIYPAACQHYAAGTWGDEPQFELRAALDSAKDAIAKANGDE